MDISSSTHNIDSPLIIHDQRDSANKLEQETPIFPTDLEINGTTYTFYATTSFPELADSLSSEFSNSIIQAKQYPNLVSLFYNPQQISEADLTEAYNRAIGEISSRS